MLCAVSPGPLSALETLSWALCQLPTPMPPLSPFFQASHCTSRLPAAVSPYDSSQDFPFPSPLGLCHTDPPSPHLWLSLASWTLLFRHEHHPGAAHLKEGKHNQLPGCHWLRRPPSICRAAAAALPTPLLSVGALPCCVPMAKTNGLSTHSAQVA